MTVSMRASAEGYWYQNGEKELGPFTVQQETEEGFTEKLVTQLGSTAEAIQAARLETVLRPMTLDDLNEVLGTTIRQDYATKLILFLSSLLTFTNEDQINVLMAGEASGGKSYLAIQITSYFPDGVPMLIGTASPAAFIHDVGEYDKETHIVRIDLRNRIIVLLDQPHYSLLQRLRALLSHDVKELQFKITDKTRSGANRTKNVIIIGFPTFIFCSAKMSLEEQELTRCFILSPETSQEKLDESLRLLAAKVGNREAYRQWVENHPLRKLLKDRIAESIRRDDRLAIALIGVIVVVLSCIAGLLGVDRGVVYSVGAVLFIGLLGTYMQWWRLKRPTYLASVSRPVIVTVGEKPASKKETD